MTLVCYRCGREAAAGARCECGEPLWTAVDAGDFSWPDSRQRGMWRYADLLPAGPPPGVGSAAGGTPLFRAPRLDEYAGCALWVKDEGRNPTGSFKDRGSAVGVARALEAGDDWVGTVSHGNMAMSTAATAAGAGLDCLVLVPDDIPQERPAHIARYDPEIVRVEGDYGRLYDESFELRGVRFVNSDTPDRVAGQKTTALEVCEAFADSRPSRRSSRADSEETDGRDAPDAIVAPVSSGGHASATWKGLRELREADLLDTVPRFYLVQAAACDPIARAYRSGAKEVTPVDGGETVAYSIANADPPSGNRALAAVRETGGAALSVSDDAILDAKRRFARRAGLSVEPASATTLAGIRRLSERGEIAPDDHVVAVATGTGFRERSDASATPREARMEDLSRLVRSLVPGSSG
ncbi:threonine synthase [Haladaptatus salinisoli]|uniref:threonine synthase n=1 Tax=Haladaptatus salinisoli TaxID=2884876 RepID=UPI001D0AC5AA|nr:threonine synthase [Haladaptatus salinisoli]